MDAAARRQQLWDLLGDLPHDHRPAPPRLIRRERHTGYTPGYTIERFELDLNGFEPVPALLLIPDRRAARAPGLLYCHWHGGQYGLGKEQLLEGCAVQPAYAPVCAEKGIVTLAIDSWCFGERQHDAEGRRGEEDTFKRMLWQGQVLWGMMLFDLARALDYLAGRPEVDAGRLGALGLSMGATQAWWLAALDERVACTIDLCCLTDYQALIDTGGLSGHGIYYYVPSLLKHFTAAEINALIAPRSRLSLNGRLDLLTPPAGVEKIRDAVMPLYRAAGCATDSDDDCRIELFDCGHEETPEMRREVLDWLDRYLGFSSGGAERRG